MRKTLALLMVFFGATLSRAEMGHWTQVGKAGDWKDTRLMAAMDGALWTIESSGTLYKTDATGHWAKVGKPGDWKDTGLMAAEDGYLWTIESGGTLYRTDSSGHWEKVGKAGDWKNTIG